jgi:dihydroorotase
MAESSPTGPAIDLALVGGRLVDPAHGLDGPGVVAIDQGRVVAGGPTSQGPEARRTIDATGLLVVPGLIDLHVHCYPDVSHYGIEPDPHCLLRGVTTAVDAGSAGAQTCGDFRRHVVETAATRVLAYLNVADQGMISPLVGELEDVRWASPERTVACANEHRDVVVGVKVRLGRPIVGSDPEPALRAARAAADQLELPLMVHVVDLPRPIDWLLSQLGEGDIVTHCFHGKDEGTLVDGRQQVLPGVVGARERGILFDVGHGAGSFDFRVARAALEQGFPPDTVSSDLHAYNVDGPVFDQATTLSKLLAIGMPLADVIACATAAPAAALRRTDDLGSLAPGRPADVTVLELVRGTQELIDAEMGCVAASEWLEPRWVVRDGVATEIAAAAVATDFYAAPSSSSA